METVTQRRVSAADAGVQKPAGAPASVFDMGRQAKAEAQAKPAEIEIRKGVPIPPDRKGRGSRYLDILGRMVTGDSVVLSDKEALSMSAAAKKAGIKVAQRALGDGKRGVWKL